ncbi:hypothetical protein R1sor_006672 [Riccia sorocarpa]|uniref:Reverse transcriptase domain-containing protein n=1 Tax=Riccia sorocarpa TaxID=122646 RepID=A0ABD3HQC9_9MARC
MLKSKCKHEEMIQLELDDGNVITEKDMILKETHRVYQSLFSENDKENDEDQAMLSQECLNFIDRRLSSSQKEELDSKPEADEIDKILVEAFWNDGRLTTNMEKGAIKLIPKTADKSKLQDWRPISLLGITYKFIKGFIQGRSVFGSILAIKLGQEWAQTSKQKSLFLKLDFVWRKLDFVKAYDRMSHSCLWDVPEKMEFDFVKAYDRVSHSYLWDVPEKMGFGLKFVSLNKGLVKNTTSVVHLNGAFTEDIELARG